MVDSDVSDEELGMAQLTLEPRQAIFEKLKDGKRQTFEGFVSQGVCQRVASHQDASRWRSSSQPDAIHHAVQEWKSDEDLTQTDMMLVDFEGNVSLAQGAICMELTIGSKTLTTTFFVIKGKRSYNLVLGRDWIHANCCIPSTMHQCIIQWIRYSVKVVQGETSLTMAAIEAQGWTYDRVSCISGKA
jgi:hypothetical protein